MAGRGAVRVAGPGFTGGQYSLLRAAFGLYLFAQFLLVVLGAMSDPGAPAGVLIAAALALLASAALAVGWLDRTATVVLLLAGGFLFGDTPRLGLPGVVVLACCLVVHLAVPPRPYGALAALGRTDPDGGWRLPGWVPIAIWVLLAAGHGVAGIEILASPVLAGPVAGSTGWVLAVLVLQFAFVGLCAVSCLRPWLWAGSLLALLGLGIVPPAVPAPVGFVGPLLLLHMLAFDPRWLPPLGVAKRAVLFYDGDCGLCHRWVRFVLAEDHAGTSCELAPLQDEMFGELVADPGSLPDSILLRFDDGRLLVRSTAVLCLMRRLGGWWRLLATVALAVPRPLLDLGYRAVAKVRRRVFRQPAGLCPIVPAHLRGRFVGGSSSGTAAPPNP